MSFPFVSGKYKKPSLVSPEALISYAGYGTTEPWVNLPSYAVLCFSDNVAQSLKGRENFLKTVPFYKTGMNIDIYKKNRLEAPQSSKELSSTRVQGKAHNEKQKTQEDKLSVSDLSNIDNKPQLVDKTLMSVCVVSRFGIGAPAGVVCLEKLRVLGVKKIVSLGLTGAINPDLKTGTKVLIQKSFRDEGCSYHYKAPSDYLEIEKDKTYVKLIETLQLKPVTSWTTDAPFRETKEEVQYFRSKGVDCVEMEASALMSAGWHYGISVFCISVVSDHLSSKGWTPQFFDPSVKKNLREILDQLLVFTFD